MDGFGSMVRCINKAEKKEDEQGTGKQKDPYYFTFFNEKNNEDDKTKDGEKTKTEDKKPQKMPAKPQIKIKTKK